jgi:ligand-binding sensor domain-containing protein
MILKTKKLFFALCILCSMCSLSANAQDTDLRIGDWDTYNPYKRVLAVAQSPENIYYATTQCVIVIEKKSHEVSYITRVTGLSDVNIAKLSYNNTTKKLLIAYANGNLDVVDNKGKITNVSDILRANIAGTRDVNMLYNEGQMMYMACSFGLLQFNMQTLQVVSSTFTPARTTHSVALRGDTIFLATSKGVMWALKTQNVQDFGVWRNQSALYTGMNGSSPSRHVINFKNTLVADANDSLFILKNRVWKFLYTDTNTNIDILNIENNTDYLVLSLNKLDAGGGSLTMLYDNGDGSQPGYYFKPYIPSSVPNIRQTVTERFSADSSRVWIADAWVGMGNYASYKYKAFPLNSPEGDRCRRLLIHPQDRALWVATGSVNGDFQYGINADGVARYKDGTWQNFNRGTNNAVYGGVIDAIVNVVRPSDGHVFTGMFASEGRPFLLEMDADGKFVKMYDSTSGTTLQAATGDPGSIRVSGLAVDKDNNIWICNANAPSPISVLRPNGTWKLINTPFPSTIVWNIMVDENDIKWIPSVDGLIAFDDGDLDKNGDERIKIFNTSNANLGAANTQMAVADLDGDIWVATAKGASVFQCGSSLFEEKSTCKGTQPIVCINGVCEELLKQNIVNCIAIDGANRKWFGTPVGIFVQSADGRNTVATFNKENAPLPSNDILSITIDTQNGVAWICTSNGLVSYRTNAVHAPEIPQDDKIVAFPNPVRPEYTGPIAINGFARDAIVKITDVSGALMYETTALGGQVVWNGMDYNGKRAASGVYLVYTSNKEGEQALVAKVAVMN